MPNPGDDVYLGSVLVNMHCWGMVSDLSTPGGITGTFEVAQNDGAITMDALVGPQGVPGENAPIVKMQYQSSIDDPDDLPDNLTDDDADIGKAWWVGNIVYLWDGEHYVPKQMGTQGPPGPVPNVHPSIQLLNPDDDDLQSEIVVSGTATNPGWLFKMKAPRGPKGDNATIRDATDYDDSTPPAVGQVITWDGSNYAPRDFNPLSTQIYSVPEAAFTSFSGFTTRQQIAAFAIPPQPFDWQPVVFGHIKAYGLEADETPFEIGMEVRVGHPTSGQLIGRGFGNSSTWTTVVPHYSTSGTPTTAITPDNSVGVVSAYHTGQAGTIYVNIFNDGFTGIYNFNKKDAQLVVMVIPVSPVEDIDWAGYRPTNATTYRVVGTFPYDIPDWIEEGDAIDVVALGGGGGGGAASALIATGQGGTSGFWTTETLIYGTDIPTTTHQLSVTVGAGGSPGTNAVTGQWGSAGADSFVFGSGVTKITAEGGIGGGSFGNEQDDNPQGITGGNAGNQQFQGFMYYGGNGGNSGKPGGTPGGGGGGGNIGGGGGPGGGGSVWISARKVQPTGS